MRWWRRHDRTGVTVLLTPIAAALVDLLYVARVGGDYQHARLLLPGFMSLCLPISLGVRQLRSLLLVPVVGIVAWSVACGGWLRYSTGGYFRSDHGIVDERGFWIAESKSQHPVTAADYHNQLGGYNRKVAALASTQERQVLLANPELYATPPGSPDFQPARSSLPFHLVVSIGAIGVTGYLSGPDAYIFDDVLSGQPGGLPLHRHPSRPAGSPEVHWHELDDRPVRNPDQLCARRGVRSVGHGSTAGLGLRAPRLISPCHHLATGILAGDLRHHPLPHLHHDDLLRTTESRRADALPLSPPHQGSDADAPEDPNPGQAGPPGADHDEWVCFDCLAGWPLPPIVEH